MLTMAVHLVSLVELFAAVCISECRVVEVSCKSGFELELSVLCPCYLSSLSFHYIAASRYCPLDGRQNFVGLLSC